MRKRRFVALVLALLMLLSTAMALTACGGEDDGGDNAAHTHEYLDKWISDATGHWHPASCEHATEKGDFSAHSFDGGKCTVCDHPDPSVAETKTYTVKATFGNGEALSGILVYVYNEAGEQVGVGFTDNSGAAVLNLAPDNYTVELKAISGKNDFLYDEESAKLGKDDAVLEITAYKTLAATEEISVEGGGIKYAAEVGENHYRISFVTEELTYFIFTPVSTGIYEVSVEADTTVEVGYYGISAYVRQTDQTAGEDRVDRSTIRIDVAPGNLATADNPATPFVIGVKGRLKSGIGTLKIERVGDHVTDIVDLPWHTYGASVNPTLYAPAESSLPGYTLTDIDVKDENVKIVYNSADGLYHYMTEDGPVVMMKIDINASYLAASVAKISETDWFRAILYDADGNFIRKETYQEMILRYVEAAKITNGGIGVYPLDEHLMTAIKNHGDFVGWWSDEPNSPTNLFGAEWSMVVKENAWMIFLCYAEILPTEHTVSVADADGTPIADVTVSVKNSAGDVIAEGTTGEDGTFAASFVHAEGIKVFLEAKTQDYVINSDGYELTGASLELVLEANN